MPEGNRNRDIGRVAWRKCSSETGCKFTSAGWAAVWILRHCVCHQFGDARRRAVDLDGRWLLVQNAMHDVRVLVVLTREEWRLPSDECRQRRSEPVDVAPFRRILARESFGRHERRSPQRGR